MQELFTFFSENLLLAIVMIGLALALTIFVFKRRKFDPGYRKGEAADPAQVKRQNPPDDLRHEPGSVPRR
jgi:hypothetical protein